MSDYLWDKTGEPEADVEELENLLGALKHKGRPLEIPATAMPNLVRPPAATIFSRPRLAIAASLILMLLAGTWLVTRQNEQQTNHLAEVKRESVTNGNRQSGNEVVSNIGTGKNTIVNPTVAPKPTENGVGIINVTVPKRQRPSQQFFARRQKRQQQPRVNKDAPTLPQREEIAVSPQEGREATAKVMLALRLASAKLNFAQRELREISRVER